MKIITRHTQENVYQIMTQSLLQSKEKFLSISLDIIALKAFKS